MNSLANKLWANNGLKTDQRGAFYNNWMAKAWQTTREVDDQCWQILEDKGMVVIDIQTSFFMLEAIAPMCAALGQILHILQPNLGSLLLTRCLTH